MERCVNNQTFSSSQGEFIASVKGIQLEVYFFKKQKSYRWATKSEGVGWTYKLHLDVMWESLALRPERSVRKHDPSSSSKRPVHQETTKKTCCFHFSIWEGWTLAWQHDSDIIRSVAVLLLFKMSGQLSPSIKWSHDSASLSLVFNGKMLEIKTLEPCSHLSVCLCGLFAAFLSKKTTRKEARTRSRVWPVTLKTTASPQATRTARSVCGESSETTTLSLFHDVWASASVCSSGCFPKSCVSASHTDLFVSVCLLRRNFNHNKEYTYTTLHWHHNAVSSLCFTPEGRSTHHPCTRLFYYIFMYNRL